MPKKIARGKPFKAEVDPAQAGNPNWVDKCKLLRELRRIAEASTRITTEIIMIRVSSARKTHEERGTVKTKTTSGTRFVLWMDMEGVSQITDYKECLPVNSEYWQTGRAKFTADTVAAASGLLKGGAEEVAVIDGHGLGWPNLLENELPKKVRPIEEGDDFADFHGVLMAGFHARCGTPDGFMSHTFVPYFRMAINDTLATECHGWALRAGVPVLGVVGDSALGTQLDGVLAGTPFLGVKKSSTRTQTMPLQPNAKESAAAIREFAETCAQGAGGRKVPKMSRSFTISFSMPRELTRLAVGKDRLTRKSPGVLTLRAGNWSERADPAIDTAMGAAANPLFTVLEGLDLSSEKAMKRAPTRKLEAARRYLADWLQNDSPAWET